jgi:hypothetical protein
MVSRYYESDPARRLKQCVEIARDENRVGINMLRNTGSTAAAEFHYRARDRLMTEARTLKLALRIGRQRQNYLDEHPEMGSW